MGSRIVVGAILLATLVIMTPVRPSSAGADPFIGEIMWVGFNFCPRGWLAAEGQLLPVNQNTALFALLGTIYGGDGRTTFAVPDLRGRVAVSMGQGPGSSTYPLGQRGGEERVVLSEAQMPTHNHAINAGKRAAAKNPAGRIPGKSPEKAYDAAARASTTMADTMVANAGDSEPHENRSPYVVLKACIALVGVFPSRN